MAVTRKPGKLVRDKIPEIILSEGPGRGVKCHVADDDEYSDALRDKLREEFKELMIALRGVDDDAVVGELADLQEVMDAITQDVIGYRPEQVERVRTAKRATKGGFANRIILDEYTT